MRTTFNTIMFLLFVVSFSCNSFDNDSRKEGGIDSIKRNFSLSAIIKNNKSLDSMSRAYEKRIYDLVNDSVLTKYKFESYRIQWDTRLHINNYIFTIENRVNKILLTVKSYSLKPADGSDYPTKDTLIVASDKIITMTDFNNFKSLLDKMEFWTMQQNDTSHKVDSFDDSDSWSIEAYNPNIKQHHIIWRKTPLSTDFKNICINVIDLFGKLDKNKINF